MTRTAAITICEARDEVRRRWEVDGARVARVRDAGGDVVFQDAPGDRGTEVVVRLPDDGGGVVREAVRKVVGTDAYAAVKDELRRFKQLVEVGEIAVSDGTPDGLRNPGQLRQLPAQPRAGARA